MKFFRGKQNAGITTLQALERLAEVMGLVSLVLVLVLALVSLAHAAAPARLPDGVPNFLDPGARSGWHAYPVGNLEGNPDFPLVMFVNLDAPHQPAAVLMGLDARNGTNRFSLKSDPIILIALFENPRTITQLYYDRGFAAEGEPSGDYSQIEHPDANALPGLLKSFTRAQHLEYL